MPARARLPLLVLIVLSLACNLSSPTAPPPAAPTPTPPPPATPIPIQPATSTPFAAASRTPPGQPLPTLSASLNTPFAPLSLKTDSGKPYAGPTLPLPLDLDKLANKALLAGLTPKQMQYLQVNGFIILRTADRQFGDVRRLAALRDGQPYFLTTDAASHALHLTFDELLKALEREQLRPQMQALTAAALQETQKIETELAGTPAAPDAALASAYLAVALRLFDPAAPLPPDLEARIAPQLAQIEQAAGLDQSALIPAFRDDYGAYRPTGHYAGDPALEAYFRGLTWLGRVEFSLVNPDQPAFTPSRAPLILTLALRRARLGEQPAGEAYARIHETLTFLIGPTDDPGPLQLAPLMDAVFGPDSSPLPLADDALWQAFLAKVPAELAAARINSAFATSSQALAAARGWRFFGQRYTLDSFILQNMLYDKVGTAQNRRLVPSGLDVVSALGSPSALLTLVLAKQDGYAHFQEQNLKMQQAARDQPPDQWLSSAYSGWLYALRAAVTDKTAGFPPFMATAGWQFKEMNTALGGWAELKHDTALYTKMPEPMGGGGPPASPAPPALVEPNPAVFYRLAWVAHSVSQGLVARGLGEPAFSYDPSVSSLSLNMLLQGMEDLGQRLDQLGDLAAREMAGQQLSADDHELILSCLGFVECFAEMAERYGQKFEQPPVPIVSAVSGAGDADILQAGVGYVDRLLVAVPLADGPTLAEGGVFSYYEFTRARSARLTDEAWRALLDSGGAQRPFWVDNLGPAGGKLVSLTFFRVGDYYIITRAGGQPPLNVRAKPARSAAVVTTLHTDDFIHIVAGPVQADGYTWWQVGYGLTDEQTGWVVENQAWYERAYGQSETVSGK